MINVARPARGFITERAVVWLVAIAACAALWAGGVWAWRTHNEAMREEGRAQVRQQWNEAVRIRQRAEDIKEAARRAAQEKADEANAHALAAARDDAARLRDAGQRMQQRIDTLVAAARRPAGEDRPAAGGGTGERDSTALDLLADMLGRADREAAELGEYADRLHAAGQLCERRYDALTPPP